MTDYSKKTNAELVDILKARSLPHTGKKAELVARIQENDQQQPAEAKTDAAEDVIDWDDDVPAESTEVPASTEAGANAIAAGGEGAVANPVAVPNQQVDTDPATTDDLKVEAAGEVPAEAEAEKKPAVDYTRGLPATELEEELRKRKARAEKFGIVEDTETAVQEAEKTLARAKRFGTGTADADAAADASVGVKGLDEALSQENPRKRGRNDQGGRGGKRRDHGRNRGRRGGQGQNQNQNQNQNQSRGNNANKGAQASNGQKNWSEKDTAAMEARKKRFETAA